MDRHRKGAYMNMPALFSGGGTQRALRAWPVLLVFLTALITRLHWIHEKENLYGDELTSVCIAYDHPGWGGKTYRAGHAYTGKELRERFYTDDLGGAEGLWRDLASLHRDNRDGSHASLYYMALRCALTGTDSPSMDTLIRRSCGLNLLFFCLSFLSLCLVLRTLFPGKTMLTAFCLLLACMNPVSVSNVLLAREYAMAEWLFALWAYWCLRAAAHVRDKGTAWTVGISAGGLAASAALLSCGYFNSLFLCLTVLCLMSYSGRRHAYVDVGFYPALCAAAVLLCVALYDGFFNFMSDVRASEVSSKMQGDDWLGNLAETLKGGVRLIVFRMLTPVWVAGILFLSAYLPLVSRRRLPLRRPPSAWLFACAWAWAAATLWMANWKIARYVSPSVPLCMTSVAYPLFGGLRRVRGWIGGFLVAAFVGYAWWERPIQYLERTAGREWPAEAGRVLLYGPDDEEKNTLNLLIPYLGDAQECVIVERVADLRRFAAGNGTTTWVYGAIDDPDLRAARGFKTEKVFNDWMSVYAFDFR